MAIYKFSNNFRTTLDGAINNSTTTIILTSTSGLPSIGANEKYSLTITDGTNIEEVTVTDDASAPSLTVTRNSDSRGAFAFADGSIIEMRPTSTQMSGMIQEVNSVQGQSITLTPDDIVSGASVTSATVATGDKVLIQDISDSDNIKTVTAQSIADLSSSISTTTTKVVIGGNSTASGYIEFLEDTDNGSNKLTLTPPQSIVTDKTVTFQDVTGTVYVSGGTDIPVADGGTGVSSVTAYAPIVGGTTSTGAFQSTESGSTGQIMQSAGNAAIPTWSTPTYPSSSGTSRKILVSDGTNNVYSTETYAVPGSSGNLMRSDGTNWTAAKATLTTDVTGVLPVANGGTNASSASITAFNNITGYTASGATGTTSTNIVFSTSPTLTNPVIGTIYDSNGNIILDTTPTSSAVNYLNITNSSAAGIYPRFRVLGSDSNIGMNFVAKGTGVIQYQSSNTIPFQILSGTPSLHTTNFSFANNSNSRTVTFPDATGTLLMTGVAISTVPSIAFSSTTGVVGTTTNDSAAAGSVGETITATGSAVAITTNTQTNVTSISLTAGDWLVYGSIKSNPAGTTTTTECASGINTTSATLPTVYAATGTAGAGIATGPTAPCVRISIASTTTVYLVARIQYAVSTCTVDGTISGVRIR